MHSTNIAPKLKIKITKIHYLIFKLIFSGKTFLLIAILDILKCYVYKNNCDILYASNFQNNVSRTADNLYNKHIIILCYIIIKYNLTSKL